MKFSNYFHIRGIHTLAGMIGAFLGVAVMAVGTFTRLYVGWIWGLLIGAGTALLLSVVFPLMLWFSDAPYRRAIAQIGEPVVYRHPVRFAIRSGGLNGYLVLTEKSIILLSFDGGNHRMELSRDDVQSVKHSAPKGTVSLFLSATKFILITSTASEELFEVLSREGWN